MWNTRITAFLMLVLPVCAAAQVVCALGPGISSYQPSADQRPSGDTMQIASRVNMAEKSICAANCPGVALFRNSTAPNAALIANAGQAKLVYAPQFFAAVYASFGDAGILAIIAHEFGHALDDSIGAAWIKTSWTPELRADAWAGCTLAKGGLSQNDMQAALAALAKYPPPSHPGWNLRLPAIRSGYTHCDGEISNFDSGTQGKRPK
jgi:hypothetical protein